MAQAPQLAAGFFTTRGAQILDATGKPVRIASIGWNQGFDNIPATVRAMRAAGFNAIRVSWVNSTRDQDLQRTDQVVAAAKANGMKVVLDCHTNTGTGPQQPNGLWFGDGGVTDQSFLADWVAVAKHYAGNDTIWGWDIRNEPTDYGSGSAWGPKNGTTKDIHAMYQRVGAAIQAINNGPLIICEGPQDYSRQMPWGDLSSVGGLPVVLPLAGKVVYSVHDYPNSIAGFTPDNGAAKVALADKCWGYLVRGDVAPVWIGEMGADMANDGERAWAATMVDYLNKQLGGKVHTNWWCWGALDGQQPNGTLDGNGNLRPEQQAVYSQFFMPPAGVPTATQPPVQTQPPAPTPDPQSGFVDWVDGNAGGMAYKVLLPKGYDSKRKDYPAVLYLHQLDMGTDVPDLLNEVNVWFQASDFRAARNAIIVMPLLDQTADQSGETINFGGVSADDSGLVKAVACFKDAVRRYPADPARYHCTGNSMGGIGTEAAAMRYNALNGTREKLFQSFLALAGADYADDPQAMAQQLRQVPLWLIHGAQDTTVQPASDRALAALMQGAPNFRYTEVAGAGHDVWDTYYLRADVWDWLLSFKGDGSMSQTQPPTGGAKETAKNTLLVGTAGSITDAAGNTWSINAAGQVVVNGQADTSTGRVVALAYGNDGKVWQQNQDKLWWGKAKPADPWAPADGTSASPISNVTPIPPVQSPPPAGGPTLSGIQATVNQAMALLTKAQMDLTVLAKG